MNMRSVLRKVLMNFTLGTVAPLVFAQTPPDDSVDGHGGRANNPQWQACKEQGDGKSLQPGEERKAFMRECLHSTQALRPAILPNPINADSATSDSNQRTATELILLFAVLTQNLSERNFGNKSP
jgi:hypothetical protein